MIKDLKRRALVRLKFLFVVLYKDVFDGINLDQCGHVDLPLPTKWFNKQGVCLRYVQITSFTRKM